MSNKGKCVSLIPYLTSSTVRLEISLRSQEPKQLESMSDPFVVVDDSPELGRLIDARFITDAGAAIKRVSLFVQRDDYRTIQDPLRPITNKTVSSIWEDAYEGYLKNPDSGLIAMSALDNEQGNLNLFNPLFLCKFRKIYFEPPCPICGAPLTLCQDDELLTSCGLPPFSSSLHRFLFCEACSRTDNQTIFYSHSKQDASQEGLKDRVELAMAFSLLAEGSAGSELLPCIGCDQKQVCFGPEGKAASRISAFSFYPFYMIPFESSQLQCIDFVALLSGAEAQEITANLNPAHIRVTRVLQLERDMGNQLRFFFGQDRRFLEILYLKLALLHQIARWLAKIPLHTSSWPGALSLDSFWIDIPEPVDSLPYFWGFKVKPHGIHACSSPGLPIDITTVNKNSFLGLAWFFVMLRNSRQGMSEILDKLGIFFAEGAPVSSEDFLEQIQSSQAPTFKPQNLFWKPEEGSVPVGYEPLWTSCLRIGWEILSSSLSESPATGVSADWIDKIAELEDRVRQALFASGTPLREVGEEAALELPDKDKEIADILAKIAAKWESEIISGIPTEVEPETPAEPLVEKTDVEETAPEPHLEETIIVAPGPPEIPSSEKPQSAEKEKISELDEIPETIIFSTSARPSSPTDIESPPPPTEPKPPETMPDTSQDQEFEKTLSMLDQELMGLVEEPSPKPQASEELQSRSSDQKPEQKQEKKEEIPETVIIKPDSG